MLLYGHTIHSAEYGVARRKVGTRSGGDQDHMADSRSGPTRPILIAGVLGGLLGGGASFIASRTITPVPTVKEEPPTPPQSVQEARQVAEAFLMSVRDGNRDQLAADVKNGVWLITEQEYESFLRQFTADRDRFVKQYGQPIRHFELVRESILCPSVVRLTYLEKYERDGVLWFFVVYHTMDGWRLVGVSWKDKLAVAATGLN